MDLARRGLDVTVVDQTDCVVDHPKLKALSCNLDEKKDWANLPSNSADAILALDVIEHLRDPEQGIDEAFRALKAGGRLIASTGNVAFLPIRLMLLFGFFNYGRRGILDQTHRRLFTIGNFKMLLERHGFKVVNQAFFGIPLSDLSGSKFWLVQRVEALSHWLARKWPGIFAYQVLFEAKRTESIHDLMASTFAMTPKSLQKLASPVGVHRETLDIRPATPALQ